MNELERYKQMEAYLKGSLKGAELEAFEKQVREDATFAKQVEQHRIANVFIKKNSLLDIKEMVAQEDRKADKARRNRVKVGSAVLLLLGLSLLVYFQTSTPKKQENPTVPAPKEKEEQKLPSVEPEQITAEPMREPRKETSKQVAGDTKPLAMDKEEPTSTLLLPLDTLPRATPRTLYPIKEAEKIEEVAHNKNATVSPCESRILSAHIIASPSCKGTATGSIQVSGFRGGVTPYQVEVRTEGDVISSPSHLASGKYEVVIKDSSGCAKTIENIWVKEQECETDFAFNPFIGDEWEIPEYPAKGTLTIFDELGKVYFRSEIRADEKFTWSGYSTNGELKTGFFPFAIKYQDGHSKTGSVTIGK